MFEHLCRRYPERLREGELRTLQRRVKEWRAGYGPASEVMFIQQHGPIRSEALEVWHGGQFVERIPRLRGAGRYYIHYRHIIDSLVRKPGAFAHYRYQSTLAFTRRMSLQALNRYFC